MPTNQSSVNKEVPKYRYREFLGKLTKPQSRNARKKIIDLGVSQPTLHRIENAKIGDKYSADTDSLTIIADVLNLSIDDLIVRI